MSDITRFTVTVAAVDNPDVPNDTRGNTPDDSIEVCSLEEASNVCRRYIADHGLGSGNWAGGEVRDMHGKVVARISYNGRIWPSP